MSRSVDIKIASDSQKLAYGIRVELLEIDTSLCGDTNGPYYICNSVTTSGSVVKWNSISYNPVDYKLTGYGMSASGKSVRPTLSIANAARTFAALVNDYEGLVGATVTRRQTRSEYLDDGDDPDSSAELPTEIYMVNKITEYNKFNITWELIAEVDREDKQIPARQAWKDFCPYIYRVYTDGAFVYDNVDECPYTATVSGSYFKRDGSATNDPSEDVCGKRLSDCRLRYTTGTVPFGGFPGMAAVRIR